MDPESTAPDTGSVTLVLPDACTDVIWRQHRGVLIAGPDTTGLARLTTETGHADQAHLTRESTRLASLSPASLIASRRHVGDPDR